MNCLFLFNFEWFHLTNVHNILAVGKLLENICLGFDQLHLDGKKLAEIDAVVFKLKSRRVIQLMHTNSCSNLTLT